MVLCSCDRCGLKSRVYLTWLQVIGITLQGLIARLCRLRNPELFCEPCFEIYIKCSMKEKRK